jgi:hypothetical protein
MSQKPMSSAMIRTTFGRAAAPEGFGAAVARPGSAIAAAPAAASLRNSRRCMVFPSTDLVLAAGTG